MDREDRKVEKEALEAEKKEKAIVEADKRLVEYAKAHGKKMPTGGIWNGREVQDRPINSGGELIPFGLSDGEKQLLRDFYNEPR